MQKLLEGVRRFQNVGCARYGSLFRRLAEEGQRPHTLFITCADSRVVAELVTDSQPGELFVVKNVGNIVPPSGVMDRTNATAAAIEFAVEVLRVGDIVVCGHSHCGAINALLLPATNGRHLPHLASWLDRFFSDLSQAKNAVFYRAVGRFGKAFIELEHHYLTMKV